MTHQANIYTRLTWLNGALDTVMKLSPPADTSLHEVEQMHHWLDRLLELDDAKAQYALWSEKRLAFSRLSEQWQQRAEQSVDAMDEEAQNLAIACANLIHFQDELQGLFSECNSTPQHRATASLRSGRRRPRATVATASNIPTFLNVTH